MAEELDAFENVAVGSHRGLRVQLGDDRMNLAVGGLAQIVGQKRVVNAQSFGNGASQARDAADVQARQCTEQANQLLTLGRVAEDVQAILDLSVLQFAKVPVDFQDKLAEVLRLRLDPQVTMQLGLLHNLPDLCLQQGQLCRIKGLALVVLIHQLFDAGNIPVAVCGGHRRNQVVNNGGVGTALGLRPLAGVVDDERVEQWHVVHCHFRVTGRREANAFTRQPLQGAVLAQVQNGVGPENVAYPAVIGDVMVSGSHFRAVVNGDGVVAEPPWGLQADKYVAQIDSGDGQAAVGAVDLPGRLAPVPGEFFPHILREGREPFTVLAGGDVPCSQP